MDEVAAIPSDAGGDPNAWDAPPRRPRDPNAAPVLAADGFEGPLDWLLEMARARKIDLRRIPLLALIETFAAALAAALPLRTTENRSCQPGSWSGADLARWGAWLVMAADLALLRSRLLAPVESADAKLAQNAAEALRQQMVARAEMSAGADWLDRQTQLGRDVFSRGAAAAGAARVGRTGDIVGLLRACLVALALPADAAAVYRVPRPPLWSVAQATARILALLPALGEAGGALTVFLPAVAAEVADRDLRCRAAMASTFLAGLELAREGTVALHQTGAGVRVHSIPDTML